MKKVAESMEKKLFNFRPMLFAAIFLILGILFGYYRKFYGISAWWLLLALPLFVWSLLPFGAWKKRLYRTLTVLSLFGVLGVGYTCFHAQVTAYANCPVYEGEYSVTGTVEFRYDYGSTVLLRLTSVRVDGEETEGLLNAYMPYANVKDIRIADRVVLSGKVKTDKSYFNKYGFADSAVRGKSCYRMTGKGCSMVGRSSNPFLRVRSRMQEVVYASMDETPAAFTLALLTGDTTGIEEGLNANMQYGGISHIFAVSGLNVGALYLFCLLLFSKTPMRRAAKPLRFGTLVGILYFYCGVCGFSASVVRAAILSGTFYFFKLLGTGSDMLSGLGFSAVLILLVSPCQLFGAGFQLSFLACLGLVLLTKRIGYVFDEVHNCFRKRHPKKYSEEERKMLEKGDTLPESVGTWVWRGTTGLLSASLAAQIATAPALLAHFGYISGWSLLLNFLFVPFTDGIFTFLLVLTAIACLLPTAFGRVLLYAPSVLWSMAMLIFEIADFSAFAMKNVQISFLSCVCYYGGILFLSDKLNLSEKVRRIAAVVCFCFAFFALLVRNL